MKKLFVFLLSAMMVFTLISCGTKPDATPDTAADTAAEQVSCGVDFDVPEGFVVSQDNDEIWLAPEYPTDSSNITVTTTQSDPAFSMYTREAVAAQIENLYQSQYGIEVDCDIPMFEKIEIDGYDAIKLECKYELNGVLLDQYEYVISADELYTITYSIVGDADWTDAFMQSADSITVLTKDAE